MTNSQLELNIANGTSRRRAVGTQRAQKRARWWFDRMREAADQAVDWRAQSITRSARAASLAPR